MARTMGAHPGLPPALKLSRLRAAPQSSGLLGKSLTDVYLLSGEKGFTQEPDRVSQRWRQIQQGHLLIPL